MSDAVDAETGDGRRDAAERDGLEEEQGRASGRREQATTSEREQTRERACRQRMQQGCGHM